MFIVGNTETRYLLYDPITKHLEHSSNVIVDETKSFRDFNCARYENYNDINRELIYNDGSTSIEAEANLVYALHVDAEGEIPSYKQAINCLDRENWLKAVEAEKKSLISNNVYTVVSFNINSKIINVHWVFTKKRDNDPTKFKVRLVAKGFMLTNHELKDVYSPVPKLEIVRIFLSIINFCNLYLKQLDFATAFLNGSLN